MYTYVPVDSITLQLAVVKNHKHKGLKTSKNIVSTHQEKYIGKKIFCFEVHADNVEGGMPGHCDRGLTAQHFFK